MRITKGKYTFIGQCSMDNKEDFNNSLRELKECYGSKNVWFDRDYTNRLIIFLTH